MYLDDKDKRLSLFSAAMDQDVVVAMKNMMKANEAASKAKREKEGDDDKGKKIV